MTNADGDDVDEEVLLEDVRRILKPFLDANPEASIQIRDEGLSVIDPWGDSSLEPENNSHGSTALTRYLPRASTDG